MTETPTLDLPLDPYRVLDLSDDTGFLCGRILGDLGADVIKIEPPPGDPSRRHGPYYQDDVDEQKSLTWFAHNYNKRGVTLDLATADGRQLFERLVASAHFVVECFPPGHLDALGLGYEALRRINPGLVMTSITPFGQTGPRRDYQADDLVAMAGGGLMYISGDEDRPPVRVGVPQAAVLAGTQAAVGTMLAHYGRVRTGHGRHLDVSVQAAVANALPNTAHLWFSDQEVQRRGARHRYGGRVIRSSFPAKDGFVATQLFWGDGAGSRMQALIDWMVDEGQPPSFQHYDFNNASGATIAQEQVDGWQREMAEFFARFTKAEIYAEALKRRVFLFAVSSPADTFSDLQLQDRDFFQDVEHPELGATVRYPGAFCRFSETPVRIRRRAPLIGEHNVEVYEDLGYSRQQLVTLKEAGVI